ncbi:MAG: virulence factor MviN, partial [Pseudomonadota bacterium]|nr:virulence factor MviN [Pseudomonadota bacterium]
MLLKAGAVSFGLLLASRLLGLLRESALAAAFGTSGLADVAVLMLSLPDWLAGVLAGGALSYVMLPAWAAQGAGRIAATQRRIARLLLLAGSVLA